MHRQFDPEKEEKVQAAIKAWKEGRAPSLNQAAVMRSVPSSTVRHRAAGRSPHTLLETQPKNQLLTAAQERALSKWIIDLWSHGFPARYDLLRSMASQLGGCKIGKNWVTRFLKRHPELTTVRSRMLEDKRGKANDIEAIIEWFTLFNCLVRKHKILPQNIWNMDEKGFMIGWAKAANVIVPTAHKRQRFCVHDGGRESVNMVECVSATGEHCAPMVIFPGKVHLAGWHEGRDSRDGWYWALSKKGVTNEELALKWLEHCFQPKSAQVAGPSSNRSQRMLILDGHGSHVSTAFIDYCRQQRILLLCLPPHSTHYLQPLDVGLFSHYARAYSDAVSSFCRYGGTGIGKREFIDLIAPVRQVAFTEKAITGGWKGAGLLPFDPLYVLNKIPSFTVADHRDLLDPIVDDLEAHMPAAGAFKTPACERILVSYVNDIRRAIDEILPSPLQHKFDKITKVAEASYAQQQILQATNNELQQALRQQRGRQQAGGRRHLSKARVLADVDIPMLVEQAQQRTKQDEQRTMQRVTRSQARLAAAGTATNDTAGAGDTTVQLTPECLTLLALR
ncbi:DDE-domain-containing protein [Drechslerella dactyloides]|uniref:DDE-domain-containing protein n=1 Tax=Drechslerella dactyloides TaxID=74499 RepID=A0AAD6NHD2_DREDA|nr:DDE-domain-containing protein [Drechslerella dactyloides]KAJ6258611.1 DDE-domain-containing protein [Drechslerella dactyloides]KAJ6259423.1 DDE-domain-containing protein [Drechslerella dactyloides]